MVEHGQVFQTQTEMRTRPLPVKHPCPLSNTFFFPPFFHLFSASCPTTGACVCRLGGFRVISGNTCREPAPTSMNTCFHSISSTPASYHLPDFKDTEWGWVFKSSLHPPHRAMSRSLLQLWMLDINNNSRRNN